MTKKHKHCWKLDRTIWITEGVGSISNTGFLKEYGYLVCSSCGAIKKVKIQNDYK